MTQSPCVIPISKQIKSDKHYASNCFSITIRDGCGIDLGVKCHSEFVDYIKSSTTCHVLSIEKTGVAAHFQVGALFASPVRQDYLRSKILQIYEPLNWNKDQIKYGLVVKHHHDARILFNYCVKEVDPLSYSFPIELNRLRGCHCPDFISTRSICRGCDPNRMTFARNKEQRFQWKRFWTNVEFSPENFFVFLDRPEYLFMKDLYRDLFPTQVVFC